MVCTIDIWNYVSICIFYISLFLQPWTTESLFSHENVKNPLFLKKVTFWFINHLFYTNPELNYFERCQSAPDLSTRQFSLISKQILWYY